LPDINEATEKDRACHRRPVFSRSQAIIPLVGYRFQVASEVNHTIRNLSIRQTAMKTRDLKEA
jgi:hypothetical protein